MPENNFSKFENLDELVNDLWNATSRRKALTIGIEISNELMHILGIDKDELPEDEDALDKAFSNAKFKNQKMEKWFEKHPYFGDGRVALYHYSGNTYPIESYFFWLNDNATKAKIAATTQLTPNWEDSELTHLPQYKVGIDFFLSAKANSLSMVITNQGNLRVMEFCERLSHTQIEILNKIKDCALIGNNESSTDQNIVGMPQKAIHQILWDALELKEVNKKFYVGIADAFELLCQYLRRNKSITENEKSYFNDVKIFSSRLLGRLLFIWFLRKKGLINKSQQYFDAESYNATEYYEKKLKVLFFKTLNTPIDERENNDHETPYLNGGLFDAHENDWADRIVKFPDQWFVALYKHLNQFNFTTDESSSEYEQIAIDPEMLGRVFENLLATIVPETSSAANDRKNKGAFYTPRDIVSFMCKESLKSYFKKVINNEKDNPGIEKLIEMNDSEFLESKSTGTSDLWGIRSDEIKLKLINAINNLKILDPACGSGAFPIGIMQLLIKTIERLSAVYDLKACKFRLGKSSEKNDVYLSKLYIIQNIIYGSDIEPMAVEISRLRAWLSLIIDDKKNVDPLPNLEFHFVCTNSLVPLTKDSFQLNLFDDYDFEYEKSYGKIINEYFNAHTKEKKLLLRNELAKLNEDKNGKKNTKRDALLKTWNPFLCKKPADFFDSKTMFNVSDFNIVIGNPPYIHFEDIKQLSKNLYEPLKYKTYEARGDIYTLFYEMGIKNLKDNGTLCFITSNKWMRAGYGESLRNFFVDYVDTELLIDLGSGVFESATVDTNIILIRKRKTKGYLSRAITMTAEYRKSNMSDFVNQNALEIEFKRNQPWVILSKIEQQIKSKIEKYGTPLGQWPDIKINYGIKTGCNEAFIIDEDKRKEILNNCKDEAERDRTDKLIRPILRGRDIKQGSYQWAGLYIINSHNGYYSTSKYVRRVDINSYPAVKKYLDNYIDKLNKRDDKGDTPYNLRSCAYMDDFNKQKIFYSETNSLEALKIAKIPELFLADKTCFVINCRFNDIEAIYNLLSSKIFKWYMMKTAPLLGEKGISLTKDTVVTFPLPKMLDPKNYNFAEDELDFIGRF